MAAPLQRVVATGREHWPFLVALGAGLVLRLVVVLAFTPALVASDAGRYLVFVEALQPNDDRPDGYGLILLWPLWQLAGSMRLVAVVQHLLGPAVAVTLYVVLRRRGVGRWVATAGVLPLLLDSLQLLLEHVALSDVLFQAVVVSGVVVLARRGGPGLPAALVAGLLLGVSTTVRQVGLPLVVVGAVYCVVATRGARRAATALVLVLGFLVPPLAYSAWYQAERGVFALSEVGGRSLYIRTVGFVDCSRLSVPDYQRVLCPDDPVGERQDPSEYGWSDPETVEALELPPGTTLDEALAGFATSAVRQQPLAYLRTVARDVALGFDVVRIDRFEYDTAWKWRFSSYDDEPVSEFDQDLYARFGGEQRAEHEPWVSFLVAYQRVGYLPGPAVLVCLLLGLSAALGVGRARASGLRSLCLLVVLAGWGLAVAPAVTTQFVWRYQLPAVTVLPVAAALGWTALRRRPPRRTSSDDALADTSADAHHPAAEDVGRGR